MINPTYAPTAPYTGEYTIQPSYKITDEGTVPRHRLPHTNQQRRKHRRIRLAQRPAPHRPHHQDHHRGRIQDLPRPLRNRRRSGRSNPRGLLIQPQPNWQAPGFKPPDGHQANCNWLPPLPSGNQERKPPMSTPTTEQYTIKPGAPVTPSGHVTSIESRRIFNNQGHQIGFAMFDEDSCTVELIRFLGYAGEYRLGPVPCDSPDQMDEVIRRHF